MSIEERILQTVKPIVPEVRPDLYTGDSTEYCTYNLDELPEGHGDDRPRAVRCLVQVHYFLPLGRSPMKTRRALARALLGAGFTYPTVTNASDSDSQHWVLECEWVEGLALDG